jgi:hypothetical protein
MAFGSHLAISLARPTGVANVVIVATFGPGGYKDMFPFGGALGTSLELAI